MVVLTAALIRSIARFGTRDDTAQCGSRAGAKTARVSSGGPVLVQKKAGRTGVGVRVAGDLPSTSKLIWRRHIVCDRVGRLAAHICLKN